MKKMAFGIIFALSLASSISFADDKFPPGVSPNLIEKLDCSDQKERQQDFDAYFTKVIQIKNFVEKSCYTTVYMKKGDVICYPYVCGENLTCFDCHADNYIVKEVDSCNMSKKPSFVKITFDKEINQTVWGDFTSQYISVEPNSDVLDPLTKKLESEYDKDESCNDIKNFDVVVKGDQHYDFEKMKRIGVHI